MAKNGPADVAERRGPSDRLDALLHRPRSKRGLKPVDDASRLPDPDAVFVGGSGRGICRLVEAAYGRLRPGGRLAATMGSIENLSESHHALRRQGAEVKVWMVNLARGNHQFERIRFESLNPTFLVSVVKPA